MIYVLFYNLDKNYDRFKNVNDPIYHPTYVFKPINHI